MTESTPVNSQAWWEHYFKALWDTHQGPDQTRHFMERLIANLPAEELAFLSQAAPTILDWGCAFGQGVEALQTTFPNTQVIGLDFSHNAVETAKRLYPDLDFVWTSEGDIPSPFDVIIISNCLEHFEDPLNLVRRQLEACRQFYVALVPYKEHPLLPEHFAQFRLESFPQQLDDFTRIAALPITVDPAYWHGEQLLVVYGAAEYMSKRAACDSQLAQVIKTQVERDVVRRERDRLLALRDQLQTELKQASAKQHQQERDYADLSARYEQLLDERLQFADLQSALERLGEENQQASDQLAKLRQQYGNLTKQHNQLMSERDRAFQRDDGEYRADQISQLQQEVTSLRWAIAQKDETLRQMRSTRAWRAANVYWHVRDTAKAELRKPLTVPYKLARRLYHLVFPLSWRLEFRYRRHPEERPGSVAALSPTFTPAPVLPAVPPQRRYDVFILSIIEFEARFQRPQQLAVHFARRGHRVFYVSSAKFLPVSDRQPYKLTEVAPNVYEVVLRSPYQPAIYETILTADLQRIYVESLQALKNDLSVSSAILLVHLSFWTRLALQMRDQWQWRIIYDCMDEWENFPLIQPITLDEERRLVKLSDLVSVTGNILYEKWSPYNRCLLVRNAVDFDFFKQARQPNSLLTYTHPIIGYYGAIAEWLDLDLLRYIAQQRPAWTFVFIGDVFVDTTPLRGLPNVHLLGRQPYQRMPLYLHHFDVCLIPFKLNNVTHAVDPVKFYEYISAGKPVVSVKLRELVIYEEYLYLAETPGEFLSQLDLAVVEQDPDLVERRIALAEANNWSARIGTLDEAIVSLFPLISIVIVTFENVDLTTQCVESIFQNSTYPNFEVILVDNHSVDTTPAYLQTLARQNPRVKIILNDENRGFAAANNQGIRIASGDYVILLNNDTVVPPGWMEGLIKHLQNPEIGMVGPVTNFCGNEARIPVPYNTFDEMTDFAQQRSRERAGQIFDIQMLAMFCVALRRETIDEIGLLDENFGVGMFEDDDYAKRMHKAGYRIVCAEDVFIHHVGQAAFKKLIETQEYQPLWDKNQSYFENKWQEPWQPHHGREDIPERNSR